MIRDDCIPFDCLFDRHIVIVTTVRVQRSTLSAQRSTFIITTFWDGATLVARLRHSCCPKRSITLYHPNVSIQEAKGFSIMTGVGSADMRSGMRCTLNPVHREPTKL